MPVKTRQERRNQDREELKQMRSVKQEWEKLDPSERRRIEIIDEQLAKVRAIMIMNPGLHLDISLMKPPTPSPPIAVPKPKREQSAVLEEIDEDEAEELKQRKELYEAEERRKEKERKKMNEEADKMSKFLYDKLYASDLQKVSKLFQFAFEDSDADDEKVWALD